MSSLRASTSAAAARPRAHRAANASGRSAAPARSAGAKRADVSARVYGGGGIEQYAGMFEEEEVIFREWPEPKFIAQVMEDFPDKGVADAEEAFCLFKEAGYKFLDVRSALEVDREGKIPNSIYVPVDHWDYKWNSEKQMKLVQKFENEEFCDEVEKKIPDKKTPLLVFCSGVPSQGEMRAILALEALDEMEYENIVYMKGGYTAFTLKFDSKLVRRVVGGFASVTNHGGTTGIHDSGAGFANENDPVGLAAMLQLQLVNYNPGGIYYDDEEEGGY
mmetsp:Transcript_5033/g.17459  ORF Transcript_5033/g.17459 Transcript_5033/m.17459 type:complete len:276 (-) Transcript_5033:71-898(-)